MQLVTKIKDKNCDRSEKIVVKARLHNYYQGWKNVTKWLKHARTAKGNLGENFGAYLIRRSLKRWRARKNTTHIARDRYNKMRQFQRDLMKKAVFNALKTKY